MVEIEEIEDPELDHPQPGPIEEDEDSADYTDTGKPFPFPLQSSSLNTSQSLSSNVSDLSDLSHFFPPRLLRLDNVSPPSALRKPLRASLRPTRHALTHDSAPNSQYVGARSRSGEERRNVGREGHVGCEHECADDWDSVGIGICG